MRRCSGRQGSETSPRRGDRTVATGEAKPVVRRAQPVVNGPEVISAPEGRGRLGVPGRIHEFAGRAIPPPLRGGFVIGGRIPRIALAGVPASLHPWLQSNRASGAIL